MNELDAGGQMWPLIFLSNKESTIPGPCLLAPVKVSLGFTPGPLEKGWWGFWNRIPNQDLNVSDVPS